MRPVTPSRRNEKNRERSATVHQRAAADALRTPHRLQPVARQPGRSASQRGCRRHAAGSEARRCRRRGCDAEGLEHVGADLERRRARCRGRARPRSSRGSHAAPSHTRVDVRLEHARRPARASRHARRRRARPSAPPAAPAGSRPPCTVQATPGSIGPRGIGRRRAVGRCAHRSRSTRVAVHLAAGRPAARRCASAKRCAVGRPPRSAASPTARPGSGCARAPR